jgi:hypothetical protein
MQKTDIIEIEFQQQKVLQAIEKSQNFDVQSMVSGHHPDGLVTVRFIGEVSKLESLVEYFKPGDEYEAYRIE